MLDEIYGILRGMITTGVVTAVDDSGQAQLVTVQTADGAIRDKVEVMLPFGVTSMPPLNGAICVLLAVGADPANLRALPVSCPAARAGQLAAGNTVIYAADGTRIEVDTGGNVTIWTKTATIKAPAGLTIEGDVTVDGVVSTTGDVIVEGRSVTADLTSST